jgi:hypothetical protein
VSSAFIHVLKNKFFACFTGFAMLGNLKIRVHAALKCLYVIFIWCALVNYLIALLDGTVKIAFGAVA